MSLLTRRDMGIPEVLWDLSFSFSPFCSSYWLILDELFSNLLIISLPSQFCYGTPLVSFSFQLLCFSILEFLYFFFNFFFLLIFSLWWDTIIIPLVLCRRFFLFFEHSKIADLKSGKSIVWASSKMVFIDCVSPLCMNYTFKSFLRLEISSQFLSSLVIFCWKLDLLNYIMWTI